MAGIQKDHGNSMGRNLGIIIGLVLLMPGHLLGNTVNLGTLGRTYPIIEKDSLEEIRERANAIDWEMVLREKAVESVKSYQPEGIPHLSKATKNETYLVDMTHTLEFDIPDAQGGILYPKGYTFNPLDYVDFRGTWIVINGEDAKQVDWFKKSDHASDIKVQLLITQGSYHDLAKRLKLPVFYAFPHIIKRLQLRAVPSVVSQQGNMMEVNIVDVTETRH